MGENETDRMHMRIGERLRDARREPTGIGELGTLIEQRDCLDCAQPFTAQIMTFDGKPSALAILRCPACIAKHEAGRTRAMAPSSRFDAVCPAEYRDCDLARLARRLGERKVLHRPVTGAPRELTPSSALADIATWNPQKHGLAIIGEPGAGKTRLMFCALRNAIEEGTPLRYLNGAEFSSEFAASYEKGAGAAHEWLVAVKSKALLFLDDLDKARLTEATITALWNILEHRHRERMTFHFTSNADGKTFAAKLRAAALKAQVEDSITDAILRRLRALADSFTL